MSFAGLARTELNSFFGRQEERDRFYCEACLVEQLRRRGARKVAAAAWTAAVEEAFANPGLLQVRHDNLCAVCRKPRPSIGAKPQDREG